MRFWDVSGPEVDAADAEPWDAPLAGTMRPFNTEALVRITLAAGVLSVVAGGVGLIGMPFATGLAAHPTLWLAVAVGSVTLGVTVFAVSSVIPPRRFRRMAPVVGMVLIMSLSVVASVGTVAWGPFLGVGAAVYVEPLIFAFYMLRLRWALLSAVLALLGFGLVVGLQDGWSAPVTQWLALAGTVVATALVVGLIGERADELGASEHEARVELAQMNRTLEQRVESQVTEIEHLGGLRRFLSPQVADVVLSGESEELGKPHRRRIAVFFCDLRGFTAFTNNAEPEEVIGVLDEYYGVVGGLLQRYDATVGDYAGDGIMAYFGDPVPRDDSAAAAVEMTHEIAGLMGPVVAEWQRRGYDLDYGVGLAHGYATLGVIGFDGRYDYKPVGGVVNLAARLCAQAGGGQVLLDHSTYIATSDRFASEHFADLDLKGYSGPTKAYSLTAG